MAKSDNFVLFLSDYNRLTNTDNFSKLSSKEDWGKGYN